MSLSFEEPGYGSHACCAIMIDFALMLSCALGRHPAMWQERLVFDCASALAAGEAPSDCYMLLHRHALAGNLL